MTKSKEYNRKDKLYEKAKSEGYRSRAAYKLKEINQRFNIISPGAKVLDIGAWPGGWLQVASEIVGEKGLVIGVDLVEIEPLGLDNVQTVTGDASDEAILQQLELLAGSKFDVAISDMSPKLCGIKEADRARAIGCAELALYIAQRMLKPDAALIIKLFKSQEASVFVKNLRTVFNTVRSLELDATRNSSNEYYVVCLGMKV